MFNSKNTMLYIFIGVFIAFTAVYFITANNISHAFMYDEKQELYDSKINMIQSISEVYAKKNVELFDEKDTVYITVQDLVDDNLLDTDNENGDVKSPVSDVKTLNNLKIKLTNNKGKITTKILENE